MSSLVPLQLRAQAFFPLLFVAFPGVAVVSAATGAEPSLSASKLAHFSSIVFPSSTGALIFFSFFTTFFESTFPITSTLDANICWNGFATKCPAPSNHSVKLLSIFCSLTFPSLLVVVTTSLYLGTCFVVLDKILMVSPVGEVPM